MEHGQDDAESGLIAQFQPDHRPWARTVQATLIWEEVPEAQIVLQLQRILRASSDSAQSPAELFGEPVDYALERAVVLRSPEQIARREMPLDNLRSLAGGVGLVIGLLLTGFGLYVAFRDGWLSHSWHVWQLASLIAGLGIAGAGHGFWYLRLSARLRAALLVPMGGLVAALGCAALLLSIGGDEALPLPNLVAPLLGLAFIVGTFLVPLTGPDIDPTAVTGGKQWFTLAERFLRGRYGFTRGEARTALRVARSHWEQVQIQDPTADPNEEFGPPAQFVVSLAADEPGPVRRRWWLKQGLYALIPLCFVIGQFAEIMNDGPSLWAWIKLVFWLAFLLFALYLMRPTARAREVSEKLAQRRRDAQTIGSGVDDD